jgi:hypothetical protein
MLPLLVQRTVPYPENPRKVVGEMNAFARKSLRAIVKLHPKNVTGEICFGM